VRWGLMGKHYEKVSKDDGWDAGEHCEVSEMSEEAVGGLYFLRCLLLVVGGLAGCP